MSFLKKTLARPLIIAAVTLGLYSNSLDAPFLFDDLSSIVGSSQIDSGFLPQSMRSGRPLADYTFALNHAISGMNVWSYHLTNVAIHILASLFLYGIVRRTIASLNLRISPMAGGIAFVIAIIWSAHPLQTQAVTYIVQRHESMMGLCYLATLYFFIRSQESTNSKNAWLIGSVLACLAGAGCKQVIVSAPLIVLWYDRAFISKRWSEIFRSRKSYYLSLFASWLILSHAFWRTTQSLHGDVIVVDSVTPWTYLCSQSEVLAHYVRLAVFPVGQCFDYAWPIANGLPDVFPCALLVLTCLIGTVWCIFHYPRVGFLGGCFFLILAPTSSVMPIKDLAVEHRMYLPLAPIVVGIVLFASWFIWRHFECGNLFEQPAEVGNDSFSDHESQCRLVRWCRIAIGGIVLCLGITTYLRNEMYAGGPEAVWSDVVNKSPRNWRAWTNLGIEYMNEGKLEQAYHAHKQSIAIEPRSAEGRANFGSLLLEQHRYDLALDQFRQATTIIPEYAFAWCGLARSHLKFGENGESLKACRTALSIRPDYEDATALLGKTLDQMGRSDEAIGVLQDFLDEKPDAPMIHSSLAAIFNNQNQFDQAESHSRESLRLSPGRIPSLLNLAVSLEGQEKLDAAKQVYQHVIDAAPNTAEAHNGIGVLYGKLNSVGLAKQSLDKAIEIQPNYAVAHSNLGALYATTGKLDKAAICLQKAIRCDPDFFGAKLNLVRVYMSHQNYAEAKQVLLELHQQHPKNTSVLLNLGITANFLGEYDEAIKHFRKLLVIDSTHAQATHNLAAMYELVGDKDNSKKYFKQYKELNK